jgi:hypothetical protein
LRKFEAGSPKYSLLQNFQLPTSSYNSPYKFLKNFHTSPDLHLHFYSYLKFSLKILNILRLINKDLNQLWLQGRHWKPSFKSETYFKPFKLFKTMARQKGIIKIKGSLGGITFYQKNGQDFSRVSNGPSKERIATDPAFKRTRENNQEFAGASAAGKAMRLGLQGFVAEMADSTLSSTLIKLFRTMINRATTGVRGERPIMIIPNKDLLVDFNFDKSTHFDSVFLAPFSVAVDATRTQVTFSIPDFDTANSVNAPQGATHIRLIGTASVLSSFSFNVNTKKYEATDPDGNTLNSFGVSGLIPIGSMVGGDTIITDVVMPATPISVDSGLLACIAIEFYQMVAGNPYLLSSNNCMKVVDVF